jgi:hypothetical protein
VSIDFRRNRPSPWRVRRLDGKLDASFACEAAARLQDALWARWKTQVPALADREPKLRAGLLERLLAHNGRRDLDPTLLTQLLADHPARDQLEVARQDGDRGPLMGNYLFGLFARWESGKLPGGRSGVRAQKTADEMRDGLHRLVCLTEWKRDAGTGRRLRDHKGNPIPLAWGLDAVARKPLLDVESSDIAAIDRRVQDEGISLEVWRKVRGYIRQAINYARLDPELEVRWPEERPNPVDLVPAPEQATARKVRKPYLPLVAEGIRADFLFLAALAEAGIRRHRIGRGEDKLWTPAGVPVPPSAEHAYQWADLVEVLYSSGCRPGEALGAEAGSYPADFLGPSYWHVAQRLVLYEGVIKPGTKSRKYPEKNVLLLGTAGETLARRALGASEGVATFSLPIPRGRVRREERLVRLLFPYPGTSVPWSSEQYANFRDDYFTPLAAARGLGPESDDPYSGRHFYTSLRIARHDPAEHIERSLGSGMVSEVYADVIHAYEGRGPLDIDAAILEAREQAVAELAQRLKPFRLEVPAVAAIGL